MCNDAFRPAKIHIILKMTKRNARNIWSFSKYLLYLRANLAFLQRHTVILCN